LALDDHGYRPQLIETIFVPRGAEERAVRKGLARAGSGIRVVATGIGPLAAATAADEAIAAGDVRSALCTGLCGLLSPAFFVGEALVYRELVAEDCEPLPLDASLGKSVAARLTSSQTGIRGLTTDRILTTAERKRAAAARFGAQAVDMESYPLALRLQRAGVAVAVARVGSDAAGDDLPALDRALDGSGGMDGFALALAMLREPPAGARLAFGATRALRALERAIAAIAAA
jgi:nucleoside phosphorylase